MKYLVVLLYITGLTFLSACRNEPKEEVGEGVAYTSRTDDMNRTIIVPVHPQRIISLTPSITELLYAFSDTTRIVGRSVYCDYPAAVRLKPSVNSYPPDIEAIVALKPDIVFVKYGMIPLQDLGKLEKLNIQVFVQKYDRLREIDHSAQTLIQLTGGDSLKLRSWLGRLTVSQPDSFKHKTFAVLASAQPIYVFGKHTFVSELLEREGGINISGDLKSTYPMMDVEYMLRSNPDILIFPSGVIPSSLFENFPVLKKIKAYKTNALYTVEESLISRPGSRLLMLKDTLSTILKR